MAHGPRWRGIRRLPDQAVLTGPPVPGQILPIAVAIVANALVGVAMPDGISQLAMSVGTGGVGIAALVGLVGLHRRQRQDQP